MPEGIPRGCSPYSLGDTDGEGMDDSRGRTGGDEVRAAGGILRRSAYPVLLLIHAGEAPIRSYLDRPGIL